MDCIAIVLLHRRFVKILFSAYNWKDDIFILFSVLLCQASISFGYLTMVPYVKWVTLHFGLANWMINIDDRVVICLPTIVSF